MGYDNSGAEGAYKKGVIAIGFGAKKDLTHNVPDTWQEFQEMHKQDIGDISKPDQWFPAYIVHRFIKEMQQGDVVLTPINTEECYIGFITSDAYWKTDISQDPHVRDVKWQGKIKTEYMNEEIRGSIYRRGTMHSLTKYAQEIEGFLRGMTSSGFGSNNASSLISSGLEFPKEKYLEDWLVANWDKLQDDVLKNYDVYSDGGEMFGQQFPVTTGKIDILAISKDKTEILVIELKKGRTSDDVVGQIQRYMGEIKIDKKRFKNIKKVKGLIIASQTDRRINLALKMTNNIDFHTYKMSFQLQKEEDDL